MSDSNQNNSGHSAWGGFLRLYWMFIGPVAVFFVAVHLAELRTPPLQLSDLAFIALGLVLIGARTVDVLYFKGQTTECEPASLGHLKRFIGFCSLIILGYWLLVRLVLLSYQG